MIVDLKAHEILVPTFDEFYALKKSKEIIIFLWDLLDGIDTVSDWAKDNDVAYRCQVEKIQKRRWETGIKTDGYTLEIPDSE